MQSGKYKMKGVLMGLFILRWWVYW